MTWQKSTQCQKQSRNRKISCPACWQTSYIPHSPGLYPPHPSGSWPPLWAFDSARLQHPAAPHWCQLWLLWGQKSPSHTVYCISTCSRRLNIKIWSPSSSFSDSSPLFSGADAFVRQKKMRLPSSANRVSSMDTIMLNTIKTRQMQKWVPAGQTDRRSEAQAATAAVCWVCVCWLTDDGAAVAVSRDGVVEDDEEHGEAEHQRDLEGVALAASERQGDADHISHDDQNSGQQ